MSLSSITKATWTITEKGAVRVGTNADYTPGGNFNIFTIAGGPVIIREMFGHVRVACTGALLVPLLAFTPTGGGAQTAVCALAAGAAWPINTMLAWSGLVAGVLTPTATIGHSDALTAGTEGFAAGSVLKLLPGIIAITNATADATAEIDWYITYKPLSTAAIITPL